jgi:hypothetical protein
MRIGNPSSFFVEPDTRVNGVIIVSLRPNETVRAFRAFGCQSFPFRHSTRWGDGHGSTAPTARRLVDGQNEESAHGSQVPVD